MQPWCFLLLVSSATEMSPCTRTDSVWVCFYNENNCCSCSTRFDFENIATKSQRLLKTNYSAATNIHYSPTRPISFSREFFCLSVPKSRGVWLVLCCSETTFDSVHMHIVIIRSHVLFYSVIMTASFSDMLQTAHSWVLNNTCTRVLTGNKTQC